MAKGLIISDREVSLIRIAIEEKQNKISAEYSIQDSSIREELDQESYEYEQIIRKLRAFELQR